MSEVELPGIPAALGLALLGAPFLIAALRRAARVLPRRDPPADRWPGVAALAVIAAPFAVFFFFSALAGGAGEAGEVTGPLVLYGLLGTQIVLGAAAVLAVALAARRAQGLASLGLASRAPPRAFGAVLLVYPPGFFCCALGLGVAWAHVCRAIGWDERQEILRLILALDRHELLVAGLVAVLLGPLIEELLFRGFLQAFLAQVLGERMALVLTSLVFARLHGMAGLPVLFALSLLLGWLQQRTRCLWVPWSVHALNNAVTLGLALALRPE